MEKEDC